jgi:hypothetical protein
MGEMGDGPVAQKPSRAGRARGDVPVGDGPRRLRKPLESGDDAGRRNRLRWVTWHRRCDVSRGFARFTHKGGGPVAALLRQRAGASGQNG